MLPDVERKCARLIYEGKRVERDIVGLCNGFPFNRWGAISLIVRLFGPQSDRKKLKELSAGIGEISGMRWNMRNLPAWQRRAMERVYLLGKWTQFDNSFVNGVARSGDFEMLTQKVEKAYEEAVNRKAWLAFLRACVEVAWLASLFVFEAKRAKRLERARKLLDANKYEESYQLSMQVVRQMRFGFTKAIVEKAVVYVAASILGIFAYQTSAGIFVAIMLFLVVFTALPYYAFTKLFYSQGEM
jgi:hypothetical protein